jgi:hypothetical protein
MRKQNKVDGLSLERNSWKAQLRAGDELDQVRMMIIIGLWLKEAIIHGRFRMSRNSQPSATTARSSPSYGHINSPRSSVYSYHIRTLVAMVSYVSSSRTVIKMR